MGNQQDILDVAVIGAGISGINTAYRLQESLPGMSYTLFEGRNDIGGTWSFFKYPGLRSDSDLFSFGFEWNPWDQENVIADAASILTYLNSSMKKYGIDKNLKLGHKLRSLDWSSHDQCWKLSFQTGEKEKIVYARWVVIGTGYYDYEKALPTVIPGIDNFKGKIVHPQFWPEDLKLSGKKVAIIGSGATAITILPNISEEAEHVTIIQRSPSYIFSLPKDPQVQFFKRWLPLSWANRLLRFKYLLLSFFFFNFCQRFPRRARKLMYKQTKQQLPKHIGVEPHFAPKYNPWDQRLCMCPDGDFYTALRSGKASIVTGHIGDITEDTIKIKDQPESSVEADVIVTATGLKLLFGGGATIAVDGKPVEIGEQMLWKGCMLQGVPNLLCVVGYTNASWTLGADVAAKTLSRVLAYTQSNNLHSATPQVAKGSDVQPTPFMKMESTYLLKARGVTPKAGTKYPWLPRGSYFTDMRDATYGTIEQDMVSKDALREGRILLTIPLCCSSEIPINPILCSAALASHDRHCSTRFR